MQHECHRVPVTALAFHGETLLAGEGNYLNAYADQSSSRFKSVKAFDSQAIHGILAAPESDAVLAWGGPHLRRLGTTGEGRHLVINVGSLYSVDDWILDAALAPASDGSHLTAGLITAHNALWILRTERAADSSAPVPNTLERAVCGSNCILYSAHIKWLSESHCLIASGTAFGDVILWSAFLEAGKATHSQVHFTFSAHEGSVFGVRMSSPLKPSGRSEESRVLASCSDDRTVRIWNVSNLASESPTLTAVQRDTGFGARPDADAHAPPLLANVMAHTSRIWHVRFLHETIPPGDVSPQILSCGEDACANVWQLKASSSELPYELELVDAKISHGGKNIWSVAQQETGALITGGADGAIARYYNLASPSRTSEIARESLSTNEKYVADNFKAYAFVNSGQLVSTTEQGRVVLVTIQNAIKELAPPLPGLRGYSVVASLDSTAFVSGNDGAIWCYSHDSAQDGQDDALSKLTQRSGKTVGLFPSQLNDACVCLLATGVGSAPASLYTLRTGALWLHSENDGLDTRQLTLPADTVVTSFAVCEEQGTNYAFVGSRSGTILIYSLQGNDSTEPLEPSSAHHLIHGREAITAILIHRKPRFPNRENPIFALSTGRDGTLAIHHVRLTTTPPTLELVHQLPVPLGPNLEGLYINDGSGHLFVYGFRGKNFVLYNTSTQQEILAVECGGAHRNWSFRFTPGRPIYSFVWTKASKVYSYSQANLNQRVTGGGGHGREIKAIAVSGRLGCVEDDDEGPEIIATGAEDTDIKLFRLHRSDASGNRDDAQRFRCLQTLRKHNTGIQHLAWDGEYLFSSGGFEELFIWKVETEVPCFELGVRCVSVHPRSGKGDLRVCGLDARRVEGDGDGGEGLEFEISMVYSDSTVQLWQYKVAENAWQLLRAGEYLTSCLTHVFRPFASRDEGEQRVVTAATDGHLALWRPSSDRTLNWTTHRKIHQSAIHALTSTTLPNKSTFIATGGDDNAIALTRLSTTMATDGTDMGVNTLLMPRAHAAAVTGLALLPLPVSLHAHETKVVAFWLISASIEQRVKLWRITVDAQKDGIEAIAVEKVQNVFTSVADVSSLEPCTLEDGGKGVLVAGVGMEVWRLPSDGNEGEIEDVDEETAEGGSRLRIEDD